MSNITYECACIFEKTRKFFIFTTVHGVATQGKAVGIMEYVTQYKLSSTMDGIAWDMYKESQTVKVSIAIPLIFPCINEESNTLMPKNIW